MGDYKKASGYPRLMQIMKGLVPTVHTFGIMSVDNPMNTSASPEANHAAQEQFKLLLKKAELGYVMHKGMYDRMEDAFFIMNASYDALVMWCDPQHFNQESFIYGEVDHQKQHRVVIKLVEGRTVTAEREVVLFMKDGEENYYSTYKGRKFQIPFFDEAYAPSKPQDSNIPEGAPFAEGSLADTPENRAHVAAIRQRDDSLRLGAFGGSGGMGAWATRGVTLRELRALKAVETGGKTAGLFQRPTLSRDDLLWAGVNPLLRPKK